MSKTLARRPAARDVGLFDTHAITLEGFVLRSRVVETVGKPTLEQWGAAFAFASSAEDSSPFWVGDLMNYAEGRSDWREQLSQALAGAGRPLSPKTLTNLAYVSRHVEGEARDLAPSLAHAAEVADLPAEDQVVWLDKAATEGWSRNELRGEVRASKRTKVLKGQATLQGRYRVLFADPPWLYRDSGATADGSLGKAERHYDGMSVDAICNLPIAAHAMPNAVLFLCVTAPMLYERPGPREVMEAWGFTYKANLVWDKVLGMPGHYGLQVNHEHLIIATRGDGMPDVSIPHDDSVLVERRTGEHSEKPASLFTFIEKHWTTGPYLELFARKPRKGWSAFGNDARLWGAHDPGVMLAKGER